MRGTQEIIDGLQQIAALEATLNEQYRLDARSLKYLGLKGLKNKFEEFGDDCSDRRREILDRIYFLGGTPAYTVAAPADQGSVTNILRSALAAENAVLPTLQDLCLQAWNAKDDNTRNLYEHWIKWHEDDHIAWLEKQLRIIDAVGEVEYISECFGG